MPEFPSSGPVSATVRIGAGTVTVSADERTSAVVEVSPADDSEASRSAAANTRVEFDAGKLRVEAPDNSGGWLRRGGRIRVRLALPAGSQLNLHSGSADVRLDGALASSQVKTGSGDTQIGSLSGDLTVNTGSGDIVADEIGGSLSVHTGSGDIKAHSIGGAVTVDTSSGDIRISAAGSVVSAKSASGDVQIGSVRGDKLIVHTASGDVSVGVPAGTRVWLDLSTASGSTRSDLNMSAAPPAEGATLNLTVRTASGDINVHRVLTPA